MDRRYPADVLREIIHTATQEVRSNDYYRNAA